MPAMPSTKYVLEDGEKRRRKELEFYPNQERFLHQRCLLFVEWNTRSSLIDLERYSVLVVAHQRFFIWSHRPVVRRPFQSLLITPCWQISRTFLVSTALSENCKVWHSKAKAASTCTTPSVIIHPNRSLPLSLSYVHVKTSLLFTQNCSPTIHFNDMGKLIDKKLTSEYIIKHWISQAADNKICAAKVGWVLEDTSNTRMTRAQQRAHRPAPTQF